MDSYIEKGNEYWESVLIDLAYDFKHLRKNPEEFIVVLEALWKVRRDRQKEYQLRNHTIVFDKTLWDPEDEGSFHNVIQFCWQVLNDELTFVELDLRKPKSYYKDE